MPRRITKETILHDEWAMLDAIKRLEKSNTRLTRKRARKEFNDTVKQFLKAYPPLDKNNEPVDQSLKPVYKCPLCKSVLYSWSGVRFHLLNMHKVGTSKIWPGDEKCFGCDKQFTDKGFPRHLAALHRKNQLDQHVIIGASYAIFGGPESENSDTKTESN